MLVGEKCPFTMSCIFFEDMHFHSAMNFKKRNIGLEESFMGHNQKNDEAP
jgi:hypothetical protein